jgi:hypothetical protein
MEMRVHRGHEKTRLRGDNKQTGWARSWWVRLAPERQLGDCCGGVGGRAGPGVRAHLAALGLAKGLRVQQSHRQCWVGGWEWCRDE